MALDEFFNRLQDISSAGTRETQFQGMRGQRSRDRQKFMEELRRQQQKAFEFAVTIPKQNYQNQRIQGGQSVFGGPVERGSALPGWQGLNYPVRGARVSSPYGVHRKGHKVTHTGIDYAIQAGSPIYAPADAIVRSTDYNGIYGNRTIIDYGGGRSSMFGHQSKYVVKPGQRIKRGQIIGYVGSTGNSTGPHLHFETWINNQPVNPLSWFL